MKNSIITFSVALFLAGCVVGFGAPSEPGPPRIESWEKPDISAEQRVLDSKDCGGTQLGSNFNDMQIMAEQQAGEGFLRALARLHDQWERCMLGKGYQYVGVCYPNETSRSSPACGAP